ncbi:PIN domain-containing protein [Microbacterium sp. B2969]|uniref:PIN domain-containing protein n=1 Tax=Microbacterium alkaliflavum TaxID=3248839 RepID=A0ABW7QE81_9MICO
MKPVVILDSNALYGAKPFTRADSAILLELARTDHIRLVIPDVVVHELSRQWVERVEENRSKAHSALGDLNETLQEGGLPALELAVPEVERRLFYEAAVSLLTRKGVEIPPCPDVPATDLLERDVATRKPFARNGKGFRDALIWENIRALCAGLEDLSTPVLFVSNNSGDFCDPEDRTALHPDLRAELAALERFEVVTFLKNVGTHEAIAPLAELLRVIEETFTAGHVERLVDDALADFTGYDLGPSDDRYSDYAPYSFRSSLKDAAFEAIMFDPSSIAFEVYRTGEVGEMAIRVTVDADCAIEGFVDKSMWDRDGYTYTEDWNRHTLRVGEERPARFTLSATFTAASIQQIRLSLDEIEEITLLTPLAADEEDDALFEAGWDDE